MKVSADHLSALDDHSPPWDVASVELHHYVCNEYDDGYNVDD